MPIYRYECEGGADCPSGGVFEISQSMKDDALSVCPQCGKKVERIIVPPNISSPTSDTDLKSKGFAKLVRRDNGVYENVTALDGESKIWDARKPETMPDIKRRISD